MFYTFALTIPKAHKITKSFDSFERNGIKSSFPFTNGKTSPSTMKTTSHKIIIIRRQISSILSTDFSLKKSRSNKTPATISIIASV